MGQNLSLKCSCCDYEIGISLGVGFFFPMLYEETIKEIKEGKLGKTLYRFLEEHPDVRTPSDLYNDNLSIYTAAKRQGFLDDIFVNKRSKKKSGRYWTKKTIQNYFCPSSLFFSVLR